MTRLLCAGALVAVGAVTGLLTVALHELWWGLTLGLSATAAAMIGLPRRWWTRPPYALGWLSAVGYLLLPRPEGDYLISSSPAGYAVLGAGVVLLAFVVATLPRSGVPSPQREESLNRIVR